MDFKGLLSGDFSGIINFDTIIQKLYVFGGIFLLAVIFGGLILAYYFLKKRNTSGTFVKLAWWEQATRGLVPSRSEEAEEIIIPGTQLRIFYVKERDLWLPRFTRGITPDLFYIALTPNRQMVNFTLKGLDNLKEAGLEFDHTDMLWAAENTREFIKRNYKDKSVKWWQAYQNVISTAILIVVMTFSFLLIIYFLRGIVNDIGGVADSLQITLKESCARSFNSGVIPA